MYSPFKVDTVFKVIYTFDFYSLLSTNACIFIPRHFQWGVCVCAGVRGWGDEEWGHIVSLLSVRTSVRPRPPRPSVPYVTLLVSVRYLLEGLVYWTEILYTGNPPIILGVMVLFNIEKFSSMKNGFHAISFERIGVLD